MPSRSAAIILADVVAHLHGGLGDAGNLVAVLLEVGQVAEDEDVREAGRIEAVVDEDAAAPVERARPGSLPRGEACTPAAQSVTAASMRWPAGLDPAGTDVGDLGTGVDFDAEPGERGFGFGGKVGG